MAPSRSIGLEQYQKDFIDFLIRSEALLFGEFTLKSGRVAPYFVNMGRFDSGEKIWRLGSFYASHLIRSLGDEFDLVFGPAYKGIPLAVATVSALYSEHKRECAYAFDRKEAKDHGDKGKIVGREIGAASRVVIVEDVITAGTTLKQVVPYLRDTLGAQVRAVIIAVDRCERGDSNDSARKEVENALGLKVLPIVDIHQILDYLSAPNSSGRELDHELLKKAQVYLSKFGA